MRCLHLPCQHAHRQKSVGLNKRERDKTLEMESKELLKFLLSLSRKISQWRAYKIELYNRTVRRKIEDSHEEKPTNVRAGGGEGGGGHRTVGGL